MSSEPMEKGTDCYFCSRCGCIVAIRRSGVNPVRDQLFRAKNRVQKGCVDDGILLCDNCSHVMIIKMAERGQLHDLEIVFH